VSRVYIACEEMDFIWSLDQVDVFKRMWKNGADIIEISETLNRDPDELALLIISLARINAIAPRDGGLKIEWSKKKLFKKRPPTQKKIDVDQLHRLYMDRTLSMDEVAGHFDSSRRRCHQIINREREKHPEKWPPRIERKGKE
jgi:hypothetical protein